MKKFLYKIAELISLIFNAWFVAAFTFLILLLANRPQNLLSLLIIAVIFGTAIPIAGIYFLMREGLTNDIHMTKRETRKLPFIIAIVSYLIGAILLHLFNAPLIVTALMVCYFGNSIVMGLVTTKWKISIHASGITGPATVLAYSFGAVALPMFLLIIPVGWSRLKMEHHTIMQIVAGAVLTVITTWIQLVLIFTLG